jgi:hypothetical protein
LASLDLDCRRHRERRLHGAMMSERHFGVRQRLPESRPLSPPLPILHAPDGFGDDPPPRKRSWAVTVGVGLLLLWAYDAYPWRRCTPADPTHPEVAPATYCHAYSAHYGWGGSAASAHGLSFGGFGHAASAHGAGG